VSLSSDKKQGPVLPGLVFYHFFFFPSADRLRVKAGRTMVGGADAGHSKFLLKRRTV